MNSAAATAGKTGVGRCGNLQRHFPHRRHLRRYDDSRMIRGYPLLQRPNQFGRRHAEHGLVFGSGGLARARCRRPANERWRLCIGIFSRDKAGVQPPELRGSKDGFHCARAGSSKPSRDGLSRGPWHRIRRVRSGTAQGMVGAGATSGRAHLITSCRGVALRYRELQDMLDLVNCSPPAWPGSTTEVASITPARSRTRRDRYSSP